MLDKLPAELLTQVLKNLSNDDLLNLPLRALQRGFLPEVGLSRFEKAYVFIEKTSLYRLARISNHPIISKYVTELVFCVEKPCKITLKRFLTRDWRDHRMGRGQYDAR